MQFGVDYAWGRPSISALKNAGVTFAARYLSHDRTGKNLTRSEATLLTYAGIPLVCVWESSARRPLDGRPAGIQDAKDADKQAAACGMPRGRPIYFAADWDADPGQQPAINSYLDGVASVISKPRTGLYGGYWPVKRAFDGGHITWGWQSYAWSGGNWDKRAHLRQYSNDHVIGGVGLDYNHAMVDDFGQWLVGGGPTPPPAPAVPKWPGRDLKQPPVMTGSDVATWQQRMKKRGWIITVDGVYGPASEAICKRFQKDKGLVQDGIVGPLTWSAAWIAPIT